MSTLNDLVHRIPVPAPWAEGEKIPWHDPEFSRRMLREHLLQAHDAASRRGEIIDGHVAWIHHNLLKSEPSQILDLGCGPGLYTSRLAQLGHACVGIDLSPASIAYARERATAGRLSCAYQLEDIRVADYGARCELVMLIFGEFNVFRPRDARQILDKCLRALKPGGHLLLEVSTADDIRELGTRPPAWTSRPSGLFSDGPYILLQENFWDPARRVATERYFVVDTASAEVTRYASSSQAYDESEYQAMLHASGFSVVAFLPPGTERSAWQGDYLLVLANA